MPEERRLFRPLLRLDELITPGWWSYMRALDNMRDDLWVWTIALAFNEGALRSWEEMTGIRAPTGP